MGEFWRIQCFGSLRLLHAGREIHHFYSQQAGLLLACLALAPESRVPRETLIERLWPETSLEIGRNRLKQTLSALRRDLDVLPEAPLLFLADRFQIGLDPDAFQTDVGEFQTLLASRTSLQNPNGEPSLEPIRSLLRAVELYRGELLEGYYADWVIAERRRLSDLHALAMTRLLQILEEEQNPLGATDLAHRLAMLDPYHEAPQRALIRIALASRNPDAAEQTFRHYEQRLKADLDAEPSEALRRLINRVSAPTRNIESETGIPTRSLPSPPRTPRLPLPVTRFFGRDDELERLQILLTDENAPRLITLLGMGGCGKTRLSLEVGQCLFSHYRERVWFIPLEEVTEAEQLPEKIALALRGGAFLTEERILESVIAQLQSDSVPMPTLLILDNFEQLTGEASARLILRLLRAVPYLRLLVSSRHPLRLQGEVEFPVLPLSTAFPAALAATPNRANSEAQEQIPAIQLLRDRLGRVCPERNFDTAENPDLLLALSRKLEGIPLAIELAASWGRSLNLAEMLARLERPFALLTSRTHDLPERHRSMYRVLEGSFDLMPSDLQEFFVSLAVFQGGWTLAAAERVIAPNALECLIELQERSLVLGEGSATVEGETRYRMLDTVREFALERLSESEWATRKEVLQRAHAETFTRFAETGNHALYHNRSSRWRQRLQADYANLIAALDWAQREPFLAFDLATNLLNPWTTECRFKEGLAALERTGKLLAGLSETENSRRIRANYWMSVGVLGYYDDRPEAEEALQRGLAIWETIGESIEGAQCLHYRAILAHEAGRHREAEALYLRALEMRTRLGDTAGRVSSLQMLGRLYCHVTVEVHDAGKGANCFREALALTQQIGDRRREGAILHFMATAAREVGDEETSFVYSQKALQIFREEDNRLGIFATCFHRPTLNRPEIEAENLIEIYRFYLDTGRPERTAGLLPRCFALAIWREQWTQAGKLAGVLRQSSGADLLTPEQFKTLAEALTPDTLRAAMQDGAMLSPVRAVALFLTDTLV